MEGEELTEQETALYDRQIRVWGVDAQRRLSKSHILVSGLKGTAVEFCKNIILAGVGSLTLNDDRPVTNELLSANFLVPPAEDIYAEKSLAELCCDSLKDFNPMVRVSVQKGDLSSFGVDFFDGFDAVIVSCCSLTSKKLVNEKCRKSSKRVAFYIVDCRDSCGEIFVDLQDYTYSKKKLEEMVECKLQYSSFEESIAVPWRTLPKRVSKLYFAMRVIERFEQHEGRNPGDTSIADLPTVLNLRKEMCEAHSFSDSQIPDALLERLLAGRREFPPVCAIIGGILGQEVIKAISGKGEPIKNFFFFDVMDGKGIIEDISKINYNIRVETRTKSHHDIPADNETLNAAITRVTPKKKTQSPKTKSAGVMEKLKRSRPTGKMENPPSKRPKTQKNRESSESESEHEPATNEEIDPGLKTNTTPWALHAVVSKLTEDQKKAVREIGFGSILSLQMTRLPKQIAKYALQRFNVQNPGITLEHVTVNIEEEDVNLVLGIPRGTKTIEMYNRDISESEEHKAFINEMKQKYEKFPPSVSSVQKRLIESTEAGDYFKREFVLFFISGFINYNSKKTIRHNLLRSLVDTNDIKNYNFCKYTLTTLIDKCQTWQRNQPSRTYFTGPITFLVLFYLDRVKFKLEERRAIPVISCWNNDAAMRREKNELAAGGFGRGKVLERAKIEDSENPLALTLLPSVFDNDKIKGLFEKATTGMIGLGSNILMFFEAYKELKAENVDVIGLFKKVRSGLLPLFQTDKEMHKEQQRAASSFNAPTDSQEDIFFESDEVLNAIDEFTKTLHKARDLKDKIIPSFDLGVDDEAQTQGGPASAPPSTKHDVYMDKETEDIVQDALDLVNFKEVAGKERQESMNQQRREGQEDRRRVRQKMMTLAALN